MCGIVGFIDRNSNFDNLKCQKVIQEMTNTLTHRGPDNFGMWHEKNLRVFLGHTRLSIIDLSKHGNQPMLSNNNNLVITFNGEIYNHKEIRKELKNQNSQKVNWRGNSDTETLINAIQIWGLKKTLTKCRGMFAFSLLDRKLRKMYLCRDRAGEKPLYYGLHNKVFFFASELNALTKHPLFVNEIDRNALYLQFKYSYVPSPFSIYKDVKKLESGKLLEISLDSEYISISDIPLPISYWALPEVNNDFDREDISSSQAREKLKYLLTQSVSEQMISDVPIGAFLSGGIDSSLIVALMQSLSLSPINTFTIGFEEDGYNEADHAERIASYLGTRHNKLLVSSSDALNVIEKLPYVYDEPFSDSSQIPTYLISNLTKQKVDVCLSGDGGDELFGGYNRYFLVSKLWKNINYLPKGVRPTLALLLKNLPTNLINISLSNILKTPLPGDKLQKIAKLIDSNSLDEIYYRLVTNGNNVGEIFGNNLDLYEPFKELSRFSNSKSIEQKMMEIDFQTYLTDDILVKVDRAAMHNSLETRVPFLDKRIIEFSRNIPLNMKIRNGNGKFILKSLLEDYLPKQFFDRPKQGFGVPIDSWLRTDLREWAEDLLSEESLKKNDIFNTMPIRRYWSEHLSKRRNWQHEIWAVLMFQSWSRAHL